MRLTPSERAIAVALDGDGARVRARPARGGREAVAQAVLNVACSGAEPAAITNCLNFGNPERPGTAYALREAITGMAEACEAFATPVVSGNVSLYNEHSGSPIHPTPVVGAVGVLERAELAVPSFPLDAGRRSLLPAPRRRRTTAASARRSRTAAPRGASPSPARRARRASAGARRGGARRAARLGATMRPTAAWWSRSSSSASRSAAAATSSCPSSPRAATSRSSARPAATCSHLRSGDRERLAELCARHGVPVVELGSLGGERIVVRAGSCTVDVALAEARDAYEDALPLAMEPR